MKDLYKNRRKYFYNTHFYIFSEAKLHQSHTDETGHRIENSKQGALIGIIGEAGLPRTGTGSLKGISNDIQSIETQDKIEL